MAIPSASSCYCRFPASADRAVVGVLRIRAEASVHSEHAFPANALVCIKTPQSCQGTQFDSVVRGSWLITCGTAALVRSNLQKMLQSHRHFPDRMLAEDYLSILNMRACDNGSVLAPSSAPLPMCLRVVHLSTSARQSHVARIRHGIRTQAGCGNIPC